MLEGRDKSLECQASGIPAPNISWRIGDRVLDSEAGSLQLHDVGRQQEGKYVCVAENRCVNKYSSMETNTKVFMINTQNSIHFL